MPERADADTGRRDQDRRRSTRFNCEGQVRISRLPSDGIFLPGAIRDLSLGGCRVDSPLLIACGARTEIVVRVNTASFRVVGEVRAIQGRSGAGIEFVQLSAGGKDMLADLISELARLQAAMNQLKSARREMEPGDFREELEEARIQAAMLSERFPSLGKILPVRSSQPDGGGSEDGDQIGEAQPLVIPVDLFG